MPFMSVSAENWDAIWFNGDIQVWCPELDDCNTPENGETVESIVSHVQVQMGILANIALRVHRGG